MEYPLTVLLCLFFLLLLLLSISTAGLNESKQGWPVPASKGVKSWEQRCKKQLQKLLAVSYPHGWCSGHAAVSPKHSLEIPVENVRIRLSPVYERRTVVSPSPARRLMSALWAYIRLCLWQSSSQHIPLLPVFSSNYSGKGRQIPLLKPLLKSVILRISLRDVVRPFNVPFL